MNYWKTLKILFNNNLGFIKNGFNVKSNNIKIHLESICLYKNKK